MTTSQPGAEGSSSMSLLAASSSTVVLKSSTTNMEHSNGNRRASMAHLPAPATRIPGFASIVNFKDEGCSISKGGGRRIQISRIPVGVTKGGAGGSMAECQNQALLHTQEIIGSAAKRRWSFHSSNQISELFKHDKALKPISPNKRRKSSGVGIVEPTEITPSTSEDSKDCQASRNSRQHQNVLTNHQQRQHNQRRISTGGRISLRQPQGSLMSTRGRQQLPDYLPKIDPYDLAFHPFRFVRKAKHFREALPQPDYLSALPDEILLRIFKQLPKPSLANLARTSHRFLKVIQDETLWKRLCVMGKTLFPEHLLVIMARKPAYLRMARTWIPDPEELPHDLETLTASSQLLYLDMTAACISPSTLALLMKISPRLEKLSLEHLKLSNEVLSEMMGFTASIEALNLTMCSDLDAKLLVRFFSGCKRLRELNMSCMSCDWSHEDLTSVVCALPESVHQLNISGYRNLLDNSHVSLIVSRCPNLIELDISDSQEVKGKAIEYMLRLPRLQHLGVSRCYGIDAQAYTLLSGHKCLKYLDLYSLFKEWLDPLLAINEAQFGYKELETKLCKLSNDQVKKSKGQICIRIE